MKKYILSATIQRNELKQKLLSLVQSVVGKENLILMSKKHVVVGLKMYPGDKTPSTTMEDTAQYIPG